MRSDRTAFNGDCESTAAVKAKCKTSKLLTFLSDCARLLGHRRYGAQRAYRAGPERQRGDLPSGWRLELDRPTALRRGRVAISHHICRVPVCGELKVVRHQHRTCVVTHSDRDARILVQYIGN